MSRTCVAFVVWTALALGGVCAPQTFAGQDSVADRVYEKYRKKGRDEGKEAPKARISLDQATNMVRKRTKGKVIGSSTSRRGNSIVHKVKVLNNGKVRTYSVDAVTGAIR